MPSWGYRTFEDARQQFARYVGRPDDASGHCALGMTLAALETCQKHGKQFERSIALAPAQTESYFRLGLSISMRKISTMRPRTSSGIWLGNRDMRALCRLWEGWFRTEAYSDAIDLLHGDSQ